MKLTVVVLISLIITIVPATVITQYQNPGYYLTSYPGGRGALILITGYDHFFSSPLFLLLAALFWINLATCTGKRFFRQVKKKGSRRFGPDILHLGLLILILGGILGFFTRQEGIVFLAPGERAALPGGSFLTVKDFIYETYPDGRPSRWLSDIIISSGPDSPGIEKAVSVNNPLRIHGLVIYQASYRYSESAGLYETGLMVSIDPSKKVIITALILISLGIILTYYQKRRDFL